MDGIMTITKTGAQPFMGRKIPILLGSLESNARCVCGKTAAELHGIMFCRCLKCGCEMRINLVEGLHDEDSNLFGTAVCSGQCRKEVRNGLQDKL